MARFCIVAPPNILSALRQDHLMGHWHLVLAHDIVKHPKEYQDLFGGDKQKANGRYVVLDNSIIELGSAVDLHVIKDAAAIVKPTCVVLPDVMLDPVATASACSAAYDEWTKVLDPVKNGYTYMYVPQGTNMYDFAWCAEQLCEEQLIGFWGIPRNLIKWLGTRRDAISICNSLNRRRLIHMLGFSDDMCQDVLDARDPNVYAIDSAVPLRLPDRMQIAKGNVRPRGDWWEHAEYSEIVKDNLELARRWFSYR